jgi:hypothetical protein
MIFKLVGFQIGISLCSKGGESSILKIDILKLSWTLRGDFIEGEFCLVKGKAFKIGGENFKSWKCFAKSYSFTFDYLQKDFEKDLQKEFAKNKTCGASVVQNIKIKKQSMHILWVFILTQIQATFALTIMQTSSIIHFYICFGLCWHQSPKRGRLNGN